MQETLSDIAYDRIQKKVISGELEPGARLVNRALSKELGFSTIPVREALRRLASEGFAEHIPGAGTFVRKVDRTDLIKLYAFREAIECFAAREAARRIAPDQLAQLEALCERFLDLAQAFRSGIRVMEAEERFQKGIEIDLAFHRIIIEAADNPWLSKSVDETRLLARIAITKPSRSNSLGEVARTYRHHVNLVRALRDSDEDLAAYWMKRQLEVGLASALQRLQ